MPTFSVTVPAASAAERLDKYLVSCESVQQQCAGLNRSKLKSIATGITVNGKDAKLSTKIRPGDSIVVDWADNIPDHIDPEDIPLDIIYEDGNVAVVNKKQGMVTHPALGNWSGTLVNALLFHWNRESVAQTARRPGIVHRLDKDTSGLIITGKNRESEEWLQTQFRDRRVKKEYIAIVAGRPPHASGTIKTQIIRDPRNRKRFKAETGTENGKFAHTQYRCIACYGSFSLMRLRLKTGRTHQIRVHMKYLGCPILGDPLYGNKTQLFPDATLMLHSRLLSIRLPGQAAFSEFKAPVPRRFKKVLKTLHGKYLKCTITR